MNFALFSSCATKVELCLFDRADATAEVRRVPLPERTDHVWHGYYPGLRPGQLYGYRVDGPFDPASGVHCDPAKLLLDPYATQLARSLVWHDAFCHESTDTVAWAPLAVVTEPEFDWGDDAPPETSWSDTVIYETHVKGMTWRHPSVPDALRGTYLGLASAPILHHLRALGVTAVELLPVHQHAPERGLTTRGLTNYWGYNSLAFLAPDMRYATTPQAAVGEFKRMVRRLHAAGLEVILDVVFNHTAEGGCSGPTLSWRGIDNRAYYRLTADGPAQYDDVTGCGNTLNLSHPRVVQLVMDSLRYWVQVMRVDGFRFDLATTLGRGADLSPWGGSFFETVGQDPCLSRVKLIAEPWDLGPDGYQAGRFPAPFREWNDRYPSTVRRFWRGDPGQLPHLATRLTGSSDMYPDDRTPTASVNYVTCHDGFTLRDVVSYCHKRNDANQERNRDGADDNHSWNCGAEGSTEDPVVLTRRYRSRRNLITTLMLSQGVPMICGGDELGRTQLGNNNAYCQDSAVSWFDWRLSAEDARFLRFVRELVGFRAQHPVLKRRRFLGGRLADGSEDTDLSWLDPGGQEMTERVWSTDDRRAVGMLLSVRVPEERDDTEQRIYDDTLLVLFNAGLERVDFRLPSQPASDGPVRWYLTLDTAQGLAAISEPVSDRYGLPSDSMAVLLRARRS